MLALVGRARGDFYSTVPSSAAYLVSFTLSCHYRVKIPFPIGLLLEGEESDRAPLPFLTFLIFPLSLFRLTLDLFGALSFSVSRKLFSPPAATRVRRTEIPRVRIVTLSSLVSRLLTSFFFCA